MLEFQRGGKSLKRLIFAIALLTLPIACAPIKTSQILEQETGIELTADIGDQILRVTKQRSLTNIFGYADLWGRQSIMGYSEVRYAGLEPDGGVVFGGKEIPDETNATPYSARRNLLIFAGSQSNAGFSETATGYGFNAAGSWSTYGTAMVPSSGSRIMLPHEYTRIDVPKNISVFFALGYQIQILDATPVRLRYRIIKLEANPYRLGAG